MRFKTALSIVTVFLCLTQCDSTTSTDTNDIDLDFGVYADSSFHTITVAHYSQVYGLPTRNTNPEYLQILDLEIVLSNPERRDEIKKILIFDELSFGWEFQNSELESNYSEERGSYLFKDLLLNSSLIDYDKLFSVRILGNQNQRDFDYNFIAKGDLPYSVNAQNYWISGGLLEYELFSRAYYYPQLRGYNAIQNSDTISINWHGGSQDLLSTETLSSTDFESEESSNIYIYQSNPPPQGTSYSSFSFTQRRTTSKYTLLTAMVPVVDLLSPNAALYDPEDNNFRVLGSNEGDVIIATPNSNDQNNYIDIKIYDEETTDKVDQFTAYGSLYNDLFSTYFDEEKNKVFYVNNQEDVYAYDLTTKTSDFVSELRFLSNIYELMIFPFGTDSILVHANNATFLVNTNTGESQSFSFGINDNVNSYYYSEEFNSLFLARNNTWFYKVFWNQESQALNLESKYNNVSQSGSSGNIFNLHVSTKDSMLFHSTGFAVSLKNNVSFSDDSSTILLPSMEGYSSVWIEEKSSLIVLEGSNNTLLHSYTFDGISFTKTGELSVINGAYSIKNSSHSSYDLETNSAYYQGQFNNRAVLIEKYSLGDFTSDIEKKSINAKYKLMKRVNN